MPLKCGIQIAESLMFNDNGLHPGQLFKSSVLDTVFNIRYCCTAIRHSTPNPIHHRIGFTGLDVS
jgi:hypothetical protein